MTENKCQIYFVSKFYSKFNYATMLSLESITTKIIFEKSFSHIETKITFYNIEKNNIVIEGYENKILIK